MDVKALQQRLLALGYSVGAAGADGIFGRDTIAAVKKFQADRGLDVKYPGTVGPKTLAALEIGPPTPDKPTPAAADAPPWFTELLRRVGLHEQRDHKKLSDWLRSDGHTLGDPAKLPWCGDAQETCIALTLPHEPMITNPYYALNWTKFGVACPIVALGALAPFRREGGGHIGQVAGHDKDYFHILGGNQSNAISIVKIAKSRLAGGLRWPKTWPLPTHALPYSTINATVSRNEA